LFRDDKAVLLAKKERLFFSLFFANLGVVIPYSLLDDAVWEEHIVNDNTRRTFLYRVKKRFPELPFEIVKNIGLIPLI